MGKLINNDEQIIVALMNNKTVKDAAKACGVGERTIYEKLRNDEFQVLYYSAKADIIKTATRAINDHLSEAIETVAEIMNDPENNAATRLQAAQIILKTSSNYTGRYDDELKTITRKIDMIEEKAAHPELYSLW